MTTENGSSISRRKFVQTTAATSLAIGAASVARSAYAGGSDTIRIGLIGCGGRGTGAALNAMQGDTGVQIHAMADLFPDRLESSFSNMRGSEWGDRVTANEERKFRGWDAYKELLTLDDIDSVILATPPQFRPVQFEASINHPAMTDGPIQKTVFAGWLMDVIERTEQKAMI